MGSFPGLEKTGGSMIFYRKKLRSLTVAGAAVTLTAITGLTGLSTVTGLTGAGTAWAAPQPAGAAYAWGANFDGQLGDGTTTERTAPVPVRLPAGAYTAVAAGEFHSLAL